MKGDKNGAERGQELKNVVNSICGAIGMTIEDGLNVTRTTHKQWKI